MSRQCANCGKTALKAANRSHSKRKTLRVQKPNLQKSKGKLECTRCTRTKTNKIK
ncbi:MAG TPA: L28 family ribosomal protein [Candidatus Magasanikbacteria bacterium]|jgi:ribosomal protein L28|nr:50S ribosomal protein L28 [Candidatus Magasanikbacteria bacterium]HQF57066.1 L28 family ribosomal protein [Candidatus Magasanikbacteria bacterium]HQL52844.1 L28 family ribosomal protein [Candidatus Magasanikbacteria bacterium]